MKLTAEQLTAIRQNNGRKSAQELAKQLGVPRRQVEEAIASVVAAPWEGRESKLLLLLGAVLVLVLGYAGYSTNLSHAEFHFDDTHAIERNDAIKTLYNQVNKNTRTDLRRGERLGRFVKKHEDAAQAIYDFNLYRMVSYWSFTYTYYAHPFDEHKADREAWEQALAGWHASNNRIHYLNGLLVLWLAWITFTAPAFRRSRAGPRLPIAAAILTAVVFVSHPLQTQAVTYLSQRAESLAATFYLLALALYATARVRSLDSGTRGSAPWLTGVVMGGAGLLLVLGAVLAAGTTLLGVGGFLKLAALATLASIGGVVYLVKSGRDEWVHAACTVGAFAAFAVGLESKEIVATLPVAICFWDLIFVPGGQLSGAPRAPAKPAWLERAWLGRALSTDFLRRVRYLGPWAAIVGGVFVLAMVFGGVNIIGKALAEGVAVGGQAGGKVLGSGAYLFTELNVFWTYLRLFLVPVGQTLDHDYPIVQLALSDGRTWLALLSGALLAACLAGVAWRGGRARVPAFALLLGLVVLAPTSSVIVLPDVIYEHRFYLPLFGAALVLAALVERGVRQLVPDSNKLQLVVMLSITGALGAGLTALTHRRNQVWKSEATLWEDAAEKSPNKPRAWTNLGLTYQNRAPYELTIRVVDDKGRQGTQTVLGLPVELPNGSSLLMTTHDMGVEPVYLPPGAILSQTERKGGPALAIESYRHALEIDAEYVKALNNLALVSINEADNQRFLAQALAQLAQAYEQQGQVARVRECVSRQTAAIEAMEASRAEAGRAYDRLVELEPDDPVYWANRGGFYATQLADYDTAYESVKRSFEFEKGPPEGRVTCATIKFIQGNDAYRAAVQAGQDPIAAALPFWELARQHYRDYLLKPGEGTFRQRARTDLDRIKRFIRGEERPAELGNATGLPDALVPSNPE